MKNRVSSSFLRACMFLLGGAALQGPCVSGQMQILDTYGTSLTSYLASASPCQGVKPLFNQRGMGLDGTLIAPPTFSWAMAGNPFGDSWTTSPRINDFTISTGAYSPTAVDWAGPTPGAASWVIARSYNQVQSTINDGPQGHGWFQMSQPELSFFASMSGNDKDVIYLVYGADRYIEFQRTGLGDTTFKSKNGAAGYMKYTSGTPDLYVYTDQVGTQTSFFGNNTSSHRADWQIWKIVDTTGNTSYVGDSSSASTAATSGYNTDKTISVAFDAASGGRRRFSYTYTAVGGVSRLQTVTVEVLTSGTWASSPVTKEIARVTYGYSSGLKLPDGYLRTVEVRTSLTDSGTSLGSGIYLTKTTFYDYYDDTWSNSDGLRGNVGMLRLVLSPEGARNYDWKDDGTLNGTYTSASASALKSYSAAYFEYPSSGTDWKASSVFFNGDCGCSGANGTFSFSYDQASSYSTYVGNTSYDTSWATRVVVAQPYAYATWYFDEASQALSKVLTDTDPAGSPTQTWVTQVVRNSDGQVTDIRSPKANTAYYHTTGGGHNAGDMTASSSVGLITTIDRVSSGAMTGFPEATRVQPGTGGTNTYVVWKSYTSTDFQYSSGIEVIRPLISAVRSYHDESSTTNSAKYDETDMSYTVWGSSNADLANLSLKTIQTTYPFVSLSKFGRGTTSSQDEPIATQYLRKDGTVAFNRDTTYYEDIHTNGIVRVQYTQLDANNQTVARVLDKKAESTWTTNYPSADNPSNWSLTLENGVGSGGNAIDAIVSSGATYDAQGRPDEVTVPYVGGTRIIKHYYSVLADGRMVHLMWPQYTSAPLFKGPATYTVSNLLGKTEFSGTLSITSSGLSDALTTWIDETDSDPVTAVKKGTLATERRLIHSDSGTQLAEARLYTSISGPSYDATTYGYDGFGRLIRTQDPDGTIRSTAYDVVGRVSYRKVGTDDSGTGSDNMTKIQALTYDGGSSGDNSLLTTRFDYVQDPNVSTSDQRETDMIYDYRGRLIVQNNPQAPESVFLYDNLSRTLAVGQYSSTSGLSASTDPTSTTTNRTALNENAYNERGQVYQTTRHNITQASGADADSISGYLWYDAMGQQIKVRGERNEKVAYDRLRRATNRFTEGKVDESDSGVTDAEYLDAFDTSGDKVLEEHQTYYDDKTSLALMTVAILRHPNDTTTTGPLDQDTNLGKVDYTTGGGKIKGRAQIMSMFYDALNRLTDRAMVGTNGGSDFTRSTDASTSRSDTNLVTSYSFNDDGTLEDVTDPRGNVTRTLYDDAQRKIATIANYVNGTPSGDNNDDDVYTRYVYTNGHLTRMWVDYDGDNVLDTGDQPTDYVYGSTKGTPSQMKIATGYLLRAIKYPDTSNTGTTVTDIDSDSSTVQSFAYNAQGQQAYSKDPGGTILLTTYDTGGRQMIRTADTLGSGIDGAIRRIETAYLSRGLVDTVTQYDATSSGNVKDQLEYSYDGWSNVTNFNQDVDSAIGGSGRSALGVVYTYAKSSASGGRITLYRDSFSFPDSEKVSYAFGSSGSFEEAAVRVSKVSQDGVDLASYSYLGAGQVVTTTMNQAGTSSSVFNSGSTTYPDLDNFNRITESIWTRSANFYDETVTYGRDSEIKEADDAVLTDIYGGHQFDAVYTNDNLNRLTEAKEGAASSGSISTCLRDEQWTLSQPGNWANHKLDLNGDLDFTDSGELNDTGTFDKANKWTARDTDTNGSPNYTLSYDGNGSMTDDGQSYKYVWDAFGRLVTVKNQSNAVVANYRYNGLGYRIAWQYDTTRLHGGLPDGTVDSNDPTFYFVYDLSWRIVATYRGSDSHVKERFVYHNAGANGLGGSSYIDLVVLRDKDANTNWYDAADSTAEERVYYAQNWRADVVALTDNNGLLIENVRYSAYGRPSSFALADVNHDGTIDGTDSTNWYTDIESHGSGGNQDLNFDGDSANSQDDTDFAASYSAASTGGFGVLSRAKTDNRIGYAGYQYDPSIASYHVRHRVYRADLGRWLTRDELRNATGPSLYEYVESRPLFNTDPMGQAAFGCWSVCWGYSGWIWNGWGTLQIATGTQCCFLGYWTQTCTCIDYCTVFGFVIPYGPYSHICNTFSVKNCVSARPDGSCPPRATPAAPTPPPLPAPPASIPGLFPPIPPSSPAPPPAPVIPPTPPTTAPRTWPGWPASVPGVP